MKPSIKNFFGYLLLALAIACVLLTFYYRFYPRLVAKRVLNQFESEVYRKQRQASLDFVHPESRLHEIFDANANTFFDTMDKFRPGFDLLKVRRYSITTPGTGETREQIEVSITKVAKHDGLERDFTEIRLRKSDGNWKVAQYVFPDLVDY